MMAVSAPAQTDARRERERALREEVREELRRTMDIEALAEPGPAEVERVRRVIAGRVDAVNRQLTAAGEPPLVDAEGLARRILDDILGLGQLQPLLDDPAVEEIIVNGPHRVFAIEGGRAAGTPAGRDQPHGGRPPA